MTERRRFQQKHNSTLMPVHRRLAATCATEPLFHWIPHTLLYPQRRIPDDDPLLLAWKSRQNPRRLPRGGAGRMNRTGWASDSEAEWTLKQSGGAMSQSAKPTAKQPETQRTDKPLPEKDLEK